MFGDVGLGRAFVGADERFLGERFLCLIPFFVATFSLFLNVAIWLGGFGYLMCTLV